MLSLENNNSGSDSKITARGANLVYLLVMVLFVTVGAFAQSQSFNIGILITEFVLIALPVFLYIILKKGSLRRELRFNRLGALDGLLIILIFMSSYPVAIFINLIGNIFVGLFGKLIQSPIPTANNFNEYFVLVLIIAGSAGICEELLFRGLVMRGYQSLGKWPNIIFTAVLFAVLHINVQNLLGPLFLGILLGYVVYITDSIFAGMLGHFVNNALAVTLSYLLMQIPFIRNASAEAVSAGAELQSLLLALIPFGIIAMFSGTMMVFCLWGLKELNRERNHEVKNDVDMTERQLLSNILRSLKISWPLYVSLIIFLAISALQLVYIATGQSVLGNIY